MKTLITADIHCGYPGRLDDCLWALRTMSAYAVEHEIANVFVLGDLYHDRVNLNIEVLSRTYAFLEETAKIDQRWLAFPGNHDMFLKNSWKHNSIRPLNGVLRAVDKQGTFDHEGLQFHILPFIENEDEYLKALEKAKGDVLLTHIGVRHAKMNFCFLLQNWSKITFDDARFKHVFAGHFHCHQTLGKLTYPGSPISFRHDDGMVPHGFLVFDSEAKNPVQFVSIYDVSKDKEKPPQHLTFIEDDFESALSFAEGNNVRIMLKRDHTVNELNEIRSKLHDAGAKAVQWVRPKEQENVEQTVGGVKINLRDYGATLNSWLEFDRPSGYSVKLLEKLNERICTEADERLVSAGIESEE
ncbi:MAG: metallophosphoesterase [Candidatus Nanopelagicaceae bacterium]|nr:metallophosphoesterase [Candidatus Nanopelagicaceae bacterium]